jgi:hypothetical protein
MVDNKTTSKSVKCEDPQCQIHYRTNLCPSSEVQGNLL